MQVLNLVQQQIRVRPRTTFLIGSTLLLNLGLWLLASVIFWSNSDAVPLHYTIYFGIDRLGQPVQLFVIPLVASLLLVANGIFSFFVYDTKKALAGLFLAMTLVWHILLMLAFGVMIYKYYGQFFSS